MITIWGVPVVATVEQVLKDIKLWRAGCYRRYLLHAVYKGIQED